MAKKIEWESVFEKALQRSEKEGKPVLLDFFNPG
ncbi:MAG: thioredoxin family protein [Proteobacteria bacterium]|nr:thioredoxin family protein [Pseudomonadota bacterium]MBU0989982.1 thioredoxin family protein [Pseudomonadota bacterium]MBU1902339.1 thioredoxin family protein [Pseudomonadota bacterium]